ncbi:hypothetical protein NDU88_006271 [Pleurodeles waltl]|uniref:Uncharacterized protein n=1 Tax=Pleurodeles waltl TaxID=8319 RepID=A0AAV7SP46_PLEWA|nr:hypothetical protein NDU88_006271 [Pleurodeles waltl]
MAAVWRLERGSGESGAWGPDVDFLCKGPGDHVPGTWLRGLVWGLEAADGAAAVPPRQAPLAGRVGSRPPLVCLLLWSRGWVLMKTVPSRGAPDWSGVETAADEVTPWTVRLLKDVVPSLL